MSNLLKKALRLGAFTALVGIVFFTNLVQKLGLTQDDHKDNSKRSDNLFTSFSDVNKAHADTPDAPGDPLPFGCDPYPNSDSGPCDPGGAGD